MPIESSCIVRLALPPPNCGGRSEEHTSELQSLSRPLFPFRTCFRSLLYCNSRMLTITSRKKCRSSPRASSGWHCRPPIAVGDRKSTRLNSSHLVVPSFPSGRASDLFCIATVGCLLLPAVRNADRVLVHRQVGIAAPQLRWDGSGTIYCITECVNISYRHFRLVRQHPGRPQRQVVLHHRRSQDIQQCLAVRYRLVAMIQAGTQRQRRIISITHPEFVTIDVLPAEARSARCAKVRACATKKIGDRKSVV